MAYDDIKASVRGPHGPFKHFTANLDEVSEVQIKTSVVLREGTNCKYSTKWLSAKWGFRKGEKYILSVVIELQVSHTLGIFKKEFLNSNMDRREANSPLPEVTSNTTPFTAR